jgi:hypothetical protein
MADHPIESHPQEIAIDNEQPIHDVIAHIKTLLTTSA